MPPVVQSSSTLGSYGTGTRNVTKPTGLQLGELLVAHAYSVGGAITPPAGWTQVFTSTVGSYPCTSEMYYKIADAGDVAASHFAFSSGAAFNVFLMRVSDFNPASPFNATVGNTTGTYGGKTIPWAATPANESNLILITAVHRRENGSASGYAVQNNNPATWTEGFDYSALSGSYHLMGALGYAQRTHISSPGNAYVTVNNGGYSGNGTYHAVMINQVPPSGPPEVETLTVDNIIHTSATISGKVVDKGLENADVVGFVISTVSETNPGDVAPNATDYEQYSEIAGDFDNDDEFSSIFREIEAGTTYYYRAYGHNGDGYYYSDEDTFETPNYAPVIDSVAPSATLLSTAQAITIHGSNFRAGVVVEINGITCTSIVVVDPETITAVTPAIATKGRYELFVENTDSKSDTSEFSFMDALPAPEQVGMINATFSITAVKYAE